MIKAKSTWMYFNLIQQGRSGPIEDEDEFGPREDWAPDLDARRRGAKKVVKPADTVWETTRDGRVRVLCSKDTPDVRVFSVDVYEQEIPPAAARRSTGTWPTRSRTCLGRRGESLQWEVEAEIAERYYARVAKEPTRWEFKPTTRSTCRRTTSTSRQRPAASRCASSSRRTD